MSFRTDPCFGFSVPTAVPGIEPHIVYPMKTWKDKAAFDETARKLVRMFQGTSSNSSGTSMPTCARPPGGVRIAAE